MIKIVLVLVYLMQGDLVIEQKPFKTMEECMSTAKVLLPLLALEPKFEQGVYAGCVPMKVTEA